MQIVPQLVRSSRPSTPPPSSQSRPLLTAPPPRLALPAPRSVEIIVERPPSRSEFLRLLGPIRGREEMQAEIRALIIEVAGAAFVPKGGRA